MYKNEVSLVFLAAIFYCVGMSLSFSQTSSVDVSFFLTYNLGAFVFFTLLCAKPTNTVILVSFACAICLMLSYVVIFFQMAGTLLYPYASDSVEYNKYASSFISGNANLPRNWDFSEYGVLIYVGVLYFIIESPIIIYLFNIIILTAIAWDFTKIGGQNMPDISLRFFGTLPANPVSHYLGIFHLKEVIMLLLVYLFFRSFYYQRNFLILLASIVLLLFFRPMLALILVLAVAIPFFLRRLMKMPLGQKINFKDFFITLIAVFLLFILYDILYEYAEKFLMRSLFVVVEYYEANGSLNDVSYETALGLSLITAVFGPLFKPFTNDYLALSPVYGAGSLFISIIILVLFLNLFKRRIYFQFEGFLFFCIHNISLALLMRGFDLRFTVFGFFVLIMSSLKSRDY